MKRSTSLWQLVGFALASLGGTLLHYLYDWSGSIWTAPFSGVNESTFEHMKLLFWPMLVFAVIESLFFRDRADFWCIKLRGIITGLVLIPVLFYTYGGVIGASPAWVNIAIFFVSAAVAYIYEAKLLNAEASRPCNKCLSLIFIFAIAILFVVFTFKTPEIGIFKDPVSGAYGI